MTTEYPTYNDLFVSHLRRMSKRESDALMRITLSTAADVIETLTVERKELLAVRDNVIDRATAEIKALDRAINNMQVLLKALVNQGEKR